VPRRRHTRSAGIVLAASLALAACGGGGSGSGSSADAGPRPDLPVAEASINSPLPPVTVRDVSTGEWVQLANALPADTPLLVWFWAPH
jgi:hypothetical protein